MTKLFSRLNVALVLAGIQPLHQRQPYDIRNMMRSYWRPSCYT